MESLTGQDIHFVSLQTAVFCVSCEIISKKKFEKPGKPEDAQKG